MVGSLHWSLINVIEVADGREHNENNLPQNSFEPFSPSLRLALLSPSIGSIQFDQLSHRNKSNTHTRTHERFLLRWFHEAGLT